MEETAADAVLQAHRDVVRASAPHLAPPSVSARRSWLSSLSALLHEHEQDIVQALHDDLKRPATESLAAEIWPLMHEVQDAHDSLEAWAKPTKANTNWLWMATGPKVVKVPKGAVLIIGAWNYPVYWRVTALLLGPLAGALAAGCSVVLKPSEQSPAVAKLIAQFIPRYLPADRVQVVLGAVSTTTTLLSLPWAHICYTGGSRVGRIVAKAAADHGTPCTLELGGKSPAVVAKDAHLATAARRIVWGKRTNSGQTCVAPDYVICIGESTRDEFVKQAVRVAKEFGDASEGGERTPSARIVSAAHYDRITRLIDNSKGEVVVRGHRDEATRELGLSIVLVGPDDSLMSEELFGPVLPILTVGSLQQACELIGSRATPLALYAFSEASSDVKYILEHTRSGGFVANDTLVHFAIPGLPFGGHGPSGYGSYHGVAGFETFSHSRSYASVPRALEAALSLRYPPFTPQRTRLLGAVQRPEGVYPGALRLRKARRAAVAALMLALLMAWPRARNLLINVTRFVPQVARRALERIHSS